jgi:ABC-type antimicrobial peptide transport system permease subunit
LDVPRTSRFLFATDAVGKYFRNLNREPVEIVGVVKDVKHEIRAAVPVVYQPIAQSGPPSASYFNVRTGVDPMSLAGAIREAIRGADPNILSPDIKTIEGYVEENLASERILARAAAFFAASALLLAAIGMFGVMSFKVTRRTGEIGIRIALGAQRGNVVWLVLREVLFLTLIGALTGLTAFASPLARLAG